MKRNYLLTLLCLLVAILLPNEVWAECFYVSGGANGISTKKSGTIIYETGTFANNAGISKIEFQYKKNSSRYGMSDVALEYYYNDTWTKYETYSLSSSYQSVSITDFSTHPNMVNATAFRVLTSGNSTTFNYTYNVQDFNVYVQSSLSVNPQEVDFGSVPVGQSVIKDVEFTYSNIGTIISSNAVAPYSVDYEVIDDCPIGGVGKVVAHIKYQPTKESVSDNTAITFTANGKSAPITTTASASAVVNPTHTWKGNDKYNVGEVLDLSQLWTSNSTGTIAFTITSFNADKENEEGAAVPVITDGNSIVLSQAGELNLELAQQATTGYNALTSSKTIKIAKNTGTLTHNLTNAYHVYDAVNIVDCYTASNSEVEVQVASSNTEVIAVVEGKLKALSVGTATVTFSQAETYKWTELTASQEITVTKYDLSASISQSAAIWDATINNPFAISYDLNDYTVEALDPSIATYTDGAIQTYAETGTARFVISRAEDYKYNQLAETLSISVAPKTESDIIYQDNKQYDINYGNLHTYTVSNVLPGDVLTVDFWETNAATGGLAIYGYENDVETEIMPNTEFSTSAKTYTFTLGKAYTSIKIKGDGGGFSVVNKHCAKFTIRRNLHISADNSNVNMESTIGTNATATISLDYGSLGSTFKVVSNNPKITVAPASFNANGSGTQEITLTGDATALGTETATITIYDQSKKTTINVTSTINRISQTISWQSSFESLNVFSTVSLDARASGTTEVVYSIAEGEQKKASIEGNVLSFKEAGTVHVVATAAQSDIYEGVSDTVSVVVSLAQPVVSVFPTVEAVVYGTALTNAMLQGGVAKYGETTVEGSFAWADERITEGLTPNTYSFNVRFTPADAKHYSTADCTVGVTVNKAQQTISWQSSFEKLNVFSKVSLGATASGSKEVVYSIAEGEQGKASIEGNVLSFNEAGTVHVVATAAQSDIYESVSDTVSVVVSLAQPVVSVFPTVEAVVYGTALTDAMLQGGVAKYGETTVEGSFAWADEQITDGLTPNTYSFNVRFTPADAKHYSTADCTVGVTVNKAQQTISWQSSFEDLNVHSEVILSATAQTAVRFAVSDTAVATITGDRLRFLKAGTIDVVAIAEGSDLYEEVADTIKGIVIARIDPVVSQWPSATLTYGKTLTDVVLAGEAVEKGVFQWGDTITDGDLVAMQIAGEYTYAVKFVPADGEQFNTLYGKATITIVEATQTISWENAPTACKVGERIALEAEASSGLAVEYYVDQIGNFATIDVKSNELVALAKGAIQLHVRQAGEVGKYLPADEWVQTINIEAGNTTATEQVVATEQASVRKILRDGVLYILRGGMCYDINGRLIGAE